MDLSIDSNVRSIILASLEKLRAGEICWQEYDKLLQTLETKDIGALKVAQTLWVVFDPEYPSNKANFTKSDFIKVREFLRSDMPILKWSR